jgi:RecA-family ATPase
VIELVLHVAAQTGHPVALVIVDTLSRAMAGGNENSPEDMTAIVGNCDRIRAATGAHVCIVHHSGKDEARGRARAQFLAGRDRHRNRDQARSRTGPSSSVRMAKQRDLEAGTVRVLAASRWRSAPIAAART